MNAETVAEWVRKAEGDYENARLLARQRKKLLADNLGWASEQCAEKYLKAFLTRHQIDFERRHDLVTLNELCTQVDGGFRLLDDTLTNLEPCSRRCDTQAHLSTRTKRALRLKRQKQHASSCAPNWD